MRAEIGTPSPAERLEAACDAVAADRDIVDLPGRISVFGPSRLPADHLRVLGALGTGREVHLWLSDASPTLWQALADEPVTIPRRRADRSATAVRHPLLQSLGRDSRELRIRLAATAGPAGSSDTHSPASPPEATLLGHLQRQIQANLDPWAQRAAHGAFRMPADDRSIQVHSCHGQPRQADVVREVVLGLLQADPTLEPRDILIMCPDLDAFAPLLSAAFSELPDGAALPASRLGTAVRTGPASSIGRLRLRIADRTPEQSNEVLGAMAAVLAMVPGRMPLSEVLDLAAHAPVRAKFGFDDEGLARLEVLTTQAGIRWGLDDDNRAEYALPPAAGTWAWGVDRLLLGVSMSEEGLPRVGGVLPVDDVQGGDVALVGRLAELVTRLRGLRAAMIAKHPVSGWAQILEIRGDRPDGRGRPRCLADPERAGRDHGTDRPCRRVRGHGRPRPGRGPLDARRDPRRTPDPVELPLRRPDRVRPRAHALGAAPRDLLGRHGRRGVPARLGPRR